MLTLLLALACTRNEPEPVDQDQDGVVASEDCDDQDPTRFPGNPETCDGIDNNCNEQVDEGALSAFYLDLDGDGHAGLEEVMACLAPENGHLTSTDCDDNNNLIHPDASEVCDGLDNDCDGDLDDADSDWDTSTGGLWFADIDGDGFGDPDQPIEACDQPEAAVVNDMDCDDAHAQANPIAVEVCDGLDNDCDGEVDPVSSLDASTWYADLDGDGFGRADLSVTACSAPPSYGEDATDCDDGDAAIFPGASEVCDGLDNDCDGETDPSTAVGASTWYRDRDGDGYGDAAASVDACEQPEIHVSDSSDCDDLDGDVNPGAVEVCDSVDNDCDGSVDPSTSADASTWYSDSDGDGFGDASSSQLACTQPSGAVSDASDCDDTAASVNPDATEVCDSVDNDCDGVTDPDDSADADTWYLDGDGDGYGDASMDTTACSQPSGYLSDDTDCDDSDAAVNPGATEVCDGADNDCDSSTGEDGTVTWTDSSGSSDVTTDWNGTSSAPAALTYSSAGTLSVCEGTWYVDLTLSADIDVVGYGSDPDDVVLDGAGLNTVVEIDTASTTVSLSNLSIENGAYDTTLFGQSGAGGLNCDVAATLELDQLELRDNSGYFGGGMGFNGCTLDATDLVMESNSAERGGDLFFYNSGFTVDGLEETTPYGRTYGGGVYADGSTGSLSDVSASGASSGTGGWLYTGSSTVTVDAADVSGGSASRFGGAVQQIGGTLEISDSSFSGNASTIYGGAFSASSGSLTLTDSEVSGNDSTRGGGLYVTGGTLELDGTHVDSNTATNYGAMLASGSTVTCDGSTNPAGFWGNASTGATTSAVVMTGVFTARSCDFGVAGTSDDNSPSDLYFAGSSGSTTTDHGDGVSFTCTSDGTCS